MVEVYEKLLGGRIVDGHGDGGKDMVFDKEPGVPIAQIKSSWKHAITSLKLSLCKDKYIPVIVGDPGQIPKEEIFESIRNAGGFIGIDVDDVETKLKACSEFREMCGTDDPALVAKRQVLLKAIIPELRNLGYDVD